jgi:hypothetical protein
MLLISLLFDEGGRGRGGEDRSVRHWSIWRQKIKLGVAGMGWDEKEKGGMCPVSTQSDE